MNAVPPLLEAISALSYAAGLLEGLPAHRCADAAAGLQVFILDLLENDEADDAKRPVGFQGGTK